MVVIAKWIELTKRRFAEGRNAIVAVAVAMPLVACTSSLDVFNGSEKVDRSISTGTIPRPARSETSLSDEATVRNAVTSVDLAKAGANPLPWANTATGSAGVVSAIREDHDQGRVCRAFRTTRHSYEGIAVFSGQACMTGSGDWTLTAFDKQG